MGTLHDRMQADIRIRRYSPCTEKAYLRCSFHFARHFMRSPADMGEEEVRSFLVHLVEVVKVSASVQKIYLDFGHFPARRGCRLTEGRC